MEIKEFDRQLEELKGVALKNRDLAEAGLGRMSDIKADLEADCSEDSPASMKAYADFLASGQFEDALYTYRDWVRRVELLEVVLV